MTACKIRNFLRKKMFFMWTNVKSQRQSINGPDEATIRA